MSYLELFFYGINRKRNLYISIITNGADNDYYGNITYENIARTNSIARTNQVTTTSLFNATYNTVNYSIISTGWQNTGTKINPDGSQANTGVYGGQYSWSN